MTTRIVRVLAATMSIAAFGVVVIGEGQPAMACQCEWPDPLAVLTSGDVVFTGWTTDAVFEGTATAGVRHFLLHVDERIVGDLPDVIGARLSFEEGDCSDTVVSLAGVIVLEPTDDPAWFRVPDCGSTIDRSAIAPYVDAPWSADGRGPPAAVVALPADGVELGILDDDGRLVGYVPGEGVTVGLSPCPGDRVFVHVRHDLSGGGLSLVRRRYDDWSVLGVTPLGGRSSQPRSLVPVVCRDGSGADVGVMLDGTSGVEVIGDRIATTAEVFGRAITLGPDGRLLDFESGGLDGWYVTSLEASADEGDGDAAVVWPDGLVDDTWVEWTSIVPTPTGWTVTIRSGGGPTDRRAVVIDVAMDGSARIGATAEMFPGRPDAVAMVVPEAVRSEIEVDATDLLGPILPPTGVRIDVDPPELPIVADDQPTGRQAAGGADTIGSGPATVAADADRGARDSTWSTWVLPLGLGVLIAAGCLTARRRRPS